MMNDGTRRQWRGFVHSVMTTGVACVLAALGGCASTALSKSEPSAITSQAPKQSAVVITGSASFRERLALPPEAVFEAVLLNVSRPGAPAIVLGRDRIQPVPGPMIAFRIPYDPAVIDSRMNYSVRATIKVGEQVWFSTEAVTPVLTHGHGNTATLTLRLTRSQSKNTEGGSETAALTNTYWRLARLDGNLVQKFPHHREAHVVLTEDGRGGHSVRALFGCNPMGGNYKVQGGMLDMTTLRTTVMACVPPLDQQEDRMKRLLQTPVQWRIKGRRMQWIDREGRTVAEFEAVYLN